MLRGRELDTGSIEDWRGFSDLSEVGLIYCGAEDKERGRGEISGVGNGDSQFKCAVLTSSVKKSELQPRTRNLNGLHRRQSITQIPNFPYPTSDHEYKYAERFWVTLVKRFD